MALLPASVDCARVEVALSELSVFLRLGELAISSLALRFLQLVVVVELLVLVAMGFQIPAWTPVSRVVGRGGRGILSFMGSSLLESYCKNTSNMK